MDVRITGVSFDWDGDGYRENGAWAGPDDGFLVFDANGDGNIDVPSEIALSELTGDSSDTDLQAVKNSSIINSDPSTVVAQAEAGSLLVEVLDNRDAGWKKK